MARARTRERQGRILNIISRSVLRSDFGGGVKVFRNLTAGLERLGYPYVVNKALDACEYLWVHDDYRALLSMRGLDPRIRVILGPNLFVMPRDIHRRAYIPPDALYLHPCRWAVDAWHKMGFNACRLAVWPVGVDLDALPDGEVGQGDRVLLYFKRRDLEGLEQVKTILQGTGLSISTIAYGEYRQEDFVAEVQRSRYVVWYGCHESQGLALLEALGMNRPVLVIDVASLREFDPGPDGYRFTEEERDLPATTVPYFDSRCGIVVRSIAALPAALREMEENLHGFRPRAFIEQDLSLEKCARNLLSLYTTRWEGPPRFGVNGKYLPSFVPPLGWVQLPIERRLREFMRRRRDG